MLQSCGVYKETTYQTTADVVWRADNGNVIESWDKAVISFRIKTSDTWNTTNESFKVTEFGLNQIEILSFYDANGIKHAIKGGLWEFNNVKEDVLNEQEYAYGDSQPYTRKVDASGKFEFSDNVYYIYKGEKMYLGANYDEAYKALIEMRNDGSIKQDVINMFVQVGKKAK